MCIIGVSKHSNRWLRLRSNSVFSTWYFDSARSPSVVLIYAIQTLKHYKTLLTYIKSAVSRNYSEKSINNILDFVSNSTDMKFLEEFYSVTLETLNDIKNDVRARIDISYTCFCCDAHRFISEALDQNKLEIGESMAGSKRI
jgi:hypothetical protein